MATRDYNVKPYLNHKSYVDMMRTVPKSSNRGGTPDSEFEKPYMNPKGDYMDMQMNHEINYSTSYESGSVAQVDSPSVIAAVEGGGDSLMDAKGIVDGVLQDSPEVSWGTAIPLVMTGYDANGKAWANITWKLLQPANGVLAGNIYTATDEKSETNITDNIMGIAPDGKFSNIIVETRPKFKIVIINTEILNYSLPTPHTNYRYNLKLVGGEAPYSYSVAGTPSSISYLQNDINTEGYIEVLITGVVDPFFSLTFTDNKGKVADLTKRIQ